MINMEFINKTPIKYLKFDSLNKIFIGVLVASVILGIVAGFLLASSSKSTNKLASSGSDSPVNAKTASQDSRTFRDFAEGTIQKKPASKNPNDYSEGTHLLVREGAVPVALTSSVVDLSQYEGKKVTVRGETQKAIKEGWLMDVGKVDVKN
jgi:hypothetical protein